MTNPNTVNVSGDVLAVYQGTAPKTVIGKGPDEKAVNLVLALATGGIGLLARKRVYQALGGDGKRLPMVALSLEEVLEATANNLATFPIGHPQADHVYARHPLHEAKYLHFAGFHREVLTEKTTEAVRLLLALGAKTITAGWESRAGSAGELTLDGEALKGFTGKSGWKSADDGSFALNIEGAGKATRLPRLAWMHHDPVFDTAVDAARAGAEKWEMTLRSDESSKVTMSLGQTLRENMGLNLGGAYQQWDKVTLTCAATF